MATKISRFYLSPFAANSAAAPTGLMGQFGSAAVTPGGTFTGTPALIQALAAWQTGLQAAWVPTSQNSPFWQDWNAILYLFSLFMSMTQQSGILEYDPTTPYFNNSFVNGGAGSNGAIYYCINDNGGTGCVGIPLSNTAYWKSLTQPTSTISVKAWGNMYGTTAHGGPAWRCEQNMGTITRTGVGQYTVGFQLNSVEAHFPDQNFCVLITGGDAGIDNADFVRVINKDTAGYNFSFEVVTTHSTPADSNEIDIVVFSLNNLTT